MKKICFITTVSITLNSFVRKFAEYLNDAGGYKIYFICDKNDNFANSLPDYVEYIPVPMKRGISIGGIKSIFKLRKIFKENKFDIIQYSTPNASCYAAIAGYLSKIPVRLYCQWGIVYVGFSGLKRCIFKSIEKLVCKLSTWVEPDSHGNLEFCHNEGIYPKNKGSVVWNGSACGVDTEKFDITMKSIWCQEIRKKYSIPANAFVYIFVGRINRDKGINELLYATKKLLEQRDDTYLLIVGDNEISGEVNEELYGWSLSEENIIYTGRTSEVEKYMAASDVYVLPSYREGFGTSVIEAEVMGVPVIVTDIPGPTNAIIKDVTGMVVPKADSEKLYEAMVSLKKDNEMLERMGMSAYEFAVANFEQTELFKKILEDRNNLIAKYCK